jgi:hypothetical protein
LQKLRDKTWATQTPHKALSVWTSRPSSQRINHTSDFDAMPVERKKTTVRSLNPDLRRACRIALMEASDTFSEYDIYSRIVRRGSFDFAGGNAADVAKELDAMVEDGEVWLANNPALHHWQRTPPRA